MRLNVLRFNFLTGSKKSAEPFSLSHSLMKLSITFFPSKYAFIRSSLMSVAATIPLDRETRPLSSKGCIKTSFSNSMISCASFRSFSILVLFKSLCKLFLLFSFTNSCSSRFNKALWVVSLTHRVTVSAFVPNPSYPPGHLLSLLIVVSMTLSASIRPEGFTLDNCTKKFPNITCS